MTNGEDFDVKEARVVYSTKELLARIDERLDRIEVAMNDAPTRREFVEVERRVGSIEEWRVAAEAVVKDRTMHLTAGQVWVAAVVSVSMFVLNVFQAYHLW